ncbi:MULTISPECIES: DUF3592 domain-containing protein [unclassified Moraxella]|uniref:DUF3592 domain-containing protein n=1 Tax=unclassified Moraxella TaxID=2685852 RepID=UPI003AF625B5
MEITKILAVLLIIGSIYYLLKALFDLKLAIQSNQWVKTPCTINDIAMTSYEDEDDNTWYDVAISYQYKVGGHTYQGSRRNFNNDTRLNLKTAQAIVAQYEPYRASPPNERATYPQSQTYKKAYAYYNPNNPKQATLEKGIKFDIFLRIILCVGLIGFLVATFF